MNPEKPGISLIARNPQPRGSTPQFPVILHVNNIKTIIRHLDGTLWAHGSTGELICRLTEKGAQQIRIIQPGVEIRTEEDVAWLMPVELVAVGQIDCHSFPDVVDGRKLSPGIRVLLVGQGNPKENGVYRISAQTWAWSGIRMPAPDRNVRVLVLEGVREGSSAWQYDVSSGAWSPTAPF